MMMYYGSYPFPPDSKAQMTSDVFLIGIAMLSRKRWWLLWKRYPVRNGLPVTRERGPMDEVRILFQSMAKLPGTEMQVLTSRQVEDNEDLLDVLVAIMQKRPDRATFTRRDLLPIAEALPSSSSRRLHRKIDLDDLRALLTLVMDLYGIFLDHSPKITSRILESLSRSFSNFPSDSEDIEWGKFNTANIQSFPNLLSTLLGFFENTFQISNHCWPEPTLLPTNCRIQQVISYSEILSAERFFQLIFVLPGALALHFSVITFQGRPDGNNARLPALLDTAGSLFLIKALNDSRSTPEEREVILAVFTGAPPEKYVDHFFMPGSWQNGSIVLSLAPSHIVYYAKREENEVGELTVDMDPGTLLLCAPGVEIQFHDEMRLLKMDTESSSFECKVEMLEVWSM
ncbi:hypothetical protein K458DRAFT_311662 [Lentithecium fluviatile CBS 122367]|uniref:TLDc domain-containing protein n=1 Tax=Lentithecium fluviatile CBS 122367 TaxID=1168545 RepID=A0A6G1IQB7_9PLEO|nr:hypothetical protein K458DRAFT_311662 [Lentithecium fluviatile CBS 122367]